MDFNLCPVCLEKYRALHYNPQAGYGPCLIPFNCIVWDDEHRPVEEGGLIGPGHDGCLHSVLRLNSARKHLWRTGEVPADAQQLWREAQELVPNWPGFQRLSLTTEQFRHLQACEEEADDIMEDMRCNSSVFVVEDKGHGVVTFVAHPPQAPQPGSPSPNWKQLFAQGRGWIVRATSYCKKAIRMRRH
jgi:hypothetical protein